QCGDERFCGIVPNFDCSVIRGGQDVWLIGCRIVVDMVDTFRLMGFQCEISVSTAAQTPDLNGSIQACTCKGVGIFWIDCQTYDIVRMPFKSLYTLPSFLPIP